MNSAERFKIAQQCINQIDDLFEYMYLSYSTRGGLQVRVREILKDYTHNITTPFGVDEWMNYNETTTN